MARTVRENTRRTARREYPYLLILSGVVIAVAWPLMQGKLTAGHDAGEYSVRLVEFVRALRDGIWLPRWAPDVDFGYGSPIFVFLPPLIYYLGAMPALLGASVVNALNFAGIAIIAASGLGMYAFAREHYGPEGSLLSAVAYLVAPFFLVTLYVRHAFTDFSALAVLPWCFWATARMCLRPARWSVLASAITMALMLLASYSVSLIALPALCALPLYQITVRTHVRRGFLALFSILLGGMLAAFGWLPTILQRGSVHSERLLQGDLYAYANHFVYPVQLLSAPWGYGVSVPGPEDGFSFALGSVHLMLAALGLCLLLWRLQSANISYKITIWMLATLIYTCVMSFGVSRPLWDAVSLLQYLQFPWRFLVLAAFALSALSGMATALVVNDKGRLAISACGIILLLAIELPHAQPSDLLVLGSDEITPQSIARRGLAATDMDEYQPKEVSRPAQSDVSPRLEVLAGAVTVQSEEKLSQQITWHLNASEDSKVRVLSYYFPGWHALADDKTVPISLEPITGLILSNIPAGTNSLQLRFEDEFLPWGGTMAAVGLIVTILAHVKGEPWASAQKS
jgi:hypothetical protein